MVKHGLTMVIEKWSTMVSTMVDQGCPWYSFDIITVHDSAEFEQSLN